ncbi:MAG TPA: NB-ARC domain-containing protein, partial [Ktedonobacteraceae bacterium]|nr:NB-ARC domain-containing protein [Ktedonobacteraceae bacterium]
MEPQVHEQEQKHPLPLWIRWLIVFFVLLLIAGGTILWIIQGAQAIIPIIVFTALGTLLAFFQFLPSLFPLSKHILVTKPPHSTQLVPNDEQTTSALQQPVDIQRASPTVSVTVHTPISTTSITSEPFDKKNENQVAGLSLKIDWGEAPHTSQFYGRDKEIDQLKQWIIDDRCRMVAVLGAGGIGKTSLAATLVEQIQEKFDYVFWRSLQNAPPLKSILQECIKCISDQQQIDLPEDIDGQISILIEYLRKHRTLLILDNGESVLQAGDRAGQYRQGYEGYGRLLQRVGEARHQSCLILTSREKTKEIARLEGSISPVHALQLPGLEQAAGHQILKDKGLIESHEAFDDLIHFYSGNPLALKLVSATVHELFGGNIAEFLKEREMSTDVQDLLDQQFQRLPQLERDLIYWLAIEREEVSLK